MPPWLKALLDLLARLFGPKPTPTPTPTPGPSGPTAPTGPTAVTGPMLPTGPTGPAPAPQPVTAQTDFRALGNTTLAAFRAALWRTVGSGPNTALATEAEALYALLERLGLTRLYLAQAWHERHNDTYQPDEAYYPHSHKNVLATKSGGAFMRFETYLDGARYWSGRILDPAGPYAKARTLAEYIHIYAPDWDGNDEAKYVADVVRQINAWPLVGGAAPGPTGPTGPTGPSGELVFGRVPKPANYSERIIAPDGVNTAFSTGSTRMPRGIVLHRMIGTLEGTDRYFRTDARHRALTDFGLGLGKVYRWTEPGANIAPYASGASSPAFSVASGDGIAFVNRYGWRQNWDCESIEIEGRQYTDPVPSADYQRLVELVAWRVDAWLRVAWNVWPKNNDGLHCLFWHNEFQNEKPCPGTVVMELTDDLVRDVAARLRSYQESR